MGTHAHTRALPRLVSYTRRLKRRHQSSKEEALNELKMLVCIKKRKTKPQSTFTLTR